MSSRRLYRESAGGKKFETFTVAVKETDLWIAVPRVGFTKALPGAVEQLVWRTRRELESYIEGDPEFARTRDPYLVPEGAPEIALRMARAGNIAGVGPMAAVAGAMAETVGRCLLRHWNEVIVENGGDIFWKGMEPLKVAILAGNSPLNKKIALLVEPAGPCGLCTSSGTSGHAFSEGRADAAVILSPSAALSDAAATAVANRVRDPDDLERALSLARQIDGVTGAVIICGEQAALWGRLQLQPL